MKKRKIRACVVSILLALGVLLGSWAGMGYGYWTDRIDAKLNITVVHPVEFYVMDDIDKEEMMLDGEYVIIDDREAQKVPLASYSNAGEEE